MKKSPLAKAIAYYLGGAIFAVVILFLIVFMIMTAPPIR